MVTRLRLIYAFKHKNVNKTNIKTRNLKKQQKENEIKKIKRKYLEMVVSSLVSSSRFIVKMTDIIQPMTKRHIFI